MNALGSISLWNIGASVLRTGLNSSIIGNHLTRINAGSKILSIDLGSRRYLNTLKDTDAAEVEDVPPENKPKWDLKYDRSKVIPLETSMRYLESKAYQETYGDIPVWVPYRRNFKGQFAPKKTRRTCIREEHLVTSNPCPICRDEYLVLDYRNVKLLKQFISPYNGSVLHWDKTGLCRTRQTELLVEIEKAKDYGTITFDLPIRNYDYSEYYKDWKP